jgi:hypothetical protein
MARSVKTAGTQAEDLRTTGTALVDWEKEMEAQAKIAAGVVANIGGNMPRFSVKGGVLSIDDQAIPGNHMAVVILDGILQNTFYEGRYDADNMTPPTCFALGRDDKTLAPHPTVVERGQAQHATCRGCPMNEFGTAENGKGKACGNRVRLMVVKAGDLTAEGRFTYDPKDYDEEHFTSAVAPVLAVPPTSIGAYATYVKSVANTLKMPPHGVFTKISVKPDPKVQVRVSFDPIMKAPVNLMKVLMARHAEVKPAIEQPYNLDQPEEAPAQAARGKPKGGTRPPVKKGKY